MAVCVNRCKINLLIHVLKRDFLCIHVREHEKGKTGCGVVHGNKEIWCLESTDICQQALRAYISSMMLSAERNRSSFPDSKGWLALELPQVNHGWVMPNKLSFTLCTILVFHKYNISLKVPHVS